jgi:two-component system, sensor histidine kinase and response regulator
MSMKFPSQKLLTLQGLARSFGEAGKWPGIQQAAVHVAERTKGFGISSVRYLEKVKAIGFTPGLDDYEKRKLGIFNLLNFLQLITGIVVPLAGLVFNLKLPMLAWIVAGLPAFISILVLWLNAKGQYYVAQIAYFVLYPFANSVAYLSGVNLGVELSFILYGILSVFFLQEISQMLFALSFSMVSYFVLAVVSKTYTYQLAPANLFVYFFNQLLAIAFIFYGLFLIKKENTGYQSSILKQKEKIALDEQLQKNQTAKLTELNAFKNRLFSIIAHDLKSPIYALRNLFRNMQQYDLPAEDIKGMVPEIVNELTYTTSLMENLLQWARSQMQADAVKPQTIDISGLMSEVAKLLRLQAEAKQIRVSLDADSTVCAFADKDMINLVLRNLLSNAIKYTPERGSIELGANKAASGVEVFVKDSGMGISPDTLRKVNLNNYYTTKGTAGESGTGLGLMLCKEFLARNGGKLLIESEPEKGSIFSFTLPQAE